MKKEEQLKREGFKHIFTRHDEAGTIYKEHAHKDKVAIFVVGGSITMNVAGKEVSLKKGDRYDVPLQTFHTAIVGPDGCDYVVGEMIKGDS